MASGGHGPYRSNRNQSFNDDDTEIRRLREYSERETYRTSRPQNILPNFSQLQINDETSSQTRQRLANLEAEIEREEDSATIVRSPTSRHGPSTREKIEESERKLRFIRTRKAEITQLCNTLKLSQTVDLCFLVDCTGSMAPYIAQVKTKIGDLVGHCEKRFDDLVLKVAFVGYRDHYDKERILFSQFTTNIPQFKSFVSKIEAHGGSDDAEDVFGGLKEAGNLDWSAPMTRILFHVADSPCHGRQYHDGVNDHFPNGDPTSLNATDLLNVLENLNIKYWFAKLTDKTDKMITEFRRLLRNPAMLQQVRKFNKYS